MNMKVDRCKPGSDYKIPFSHLNSLTKSKHVSFMNYDVSSKTVLFCPVLAGIVLL